eukprot:scaffold71873_cov43-Phaeocystis_antarctica.AAC.1
MSWLRRGCRRRCSSTPEARAAAGWAAAARALVAEARAVPEATAAVGAAVRSPQASGRRRR